jgi:hypothetical protein
MKKRAPEDPGDARSANKIIYIAYCKRVDDLKISLRCKAYPEFYSYFSLGRCSFAWANI